MTNNNIVFRSKFEKVVTEQNREAMQTAVLKFCEFSANKALKQLWRMGYTAKAYKDALEKGEEAIKVAKPYALEILSLIGLTEEHISLESMELLRNELRYQYEQKVPNFLDVKPWDEACKVAFEELKNQTDPIIANTVYNHCAERVYITGIDRVLSLLSREDEKYFYGGIRSLSFSKVESSYLKSFHKQIYDLLKVMHEYKVQSEVAKGNNNPFAKLADMFEADETEASANEEAAAPVATLVAEEVTEVAKAKAKVENTTDTTEDVTENSEVPDFQVKVFEVVTPCEIFKHQKLFSAFLSSDLNALSEIANLGFDLNEVMAKKGKISALLDAIKAFSK